jgi:hypothetical protein
VELTAWLTSPSACSDHPAFNCVLEIPARGALSGAFPELQIDRSRRRRETDHRHLLRVERPRECRAAARVAENFRRPIFASKFNCCCALPAAPRDMDAT